MSNSANQNGMQFSQEQSTTQQSTTQQSTPHQRAFKRYADATPLSELQQAPAPVDCPICGVREMTRAENVVGSVTQFVSPNSYDE
jgi:lipopolysaccharide-induced tumor necrosis factor-alpha factor